MNYNTIFHTNTYSVNTLLNNKNMFEILIYTFKNVTKHIADYVGLRETPKSSWNPYLVNTALDDGKTFKTDKRG